MPLQKWSLLELAQLCLLFQGLWFAHLGTSASVQTFFLQSVCISRKRWASHRERDKVDSITYCTGNPKRVWLIHNVRSLPNFYKNFTGYTPTFCLLKRGNNACAWRRKSYIYWNESHSFKYLPANCLQGITNLKQNKTEIDTNLREEVASLKFWHVWIPRHVCVILYKQSKTI